MSGIFREFVGQVVRALPDDLEEVAMQRWIAAPGELRRALGEALGGINIAEFFRTRPGIDVWSEFTERILAPALAGGSSVPATVGEPLNLPPGGMTDAEIRAKLHADFEDARAFCLYLAGALKRQWGGEAGPLLTNGATNIFHVRGLNGGVFAVDVSWAADGRRWLVLANRLDDNPWNAGNRAFPRN